MKLKARGYVGAADDQEMLELAAEMADSYLHWIDLPYRSSSWSFDMPGNTFLFEDGEGALQGWASFQTPFWFVDLYARHVQEDRNDLPEILAWLDEKAANLLDTPSGHPIWFTGVFEGDAERTATLEQAGYTCISFVEENAWLKVWLAREVGGDLPVPALPPGFILRPLAGAAEVDAYVALHRHAFGSENMTHDWRLRTLAHPGYRPDLDLVVQAPDGRLAGFLIAWVAAGVDGVLYGQVEPMGVHEDFRRMGLGRALLYETFRRMANLGAKRVFVECDGYPDGADYLNYAAAGFELQRKFLVYLKDYAPISG